MTQKSRFFITTPIYYSNGVPHIGHSYASLIADIIARKKRMMGADVKFSTWVDENSQKVVEKAEELWMEVMEYADSMALKHKAVWDGLGISYTDFIRTTEPRHKKLVQEVLQKSFDNGDIYEGMYEGKYCVGCEAFKKDADLTPDGKCIDHPNKEIQFLKEKNYFFRLSKYQDTLLRFYEENADFILPHSRRNEVLEFIKWWLEDFSISRETNRFGIPLPFDESQVTYVWYDALFNYVTVCQGEEQDFWPANLHVVGKDIVKFHGIYWPAMLLSAGYTLPKQILVTGYFTVNGQKMSKTIGNVIDPVEFSHKYSKDLLTLYLLSAFPIGEDGDFSEEQAILMYNAKLANNLGNLLNRFIALGLKEGWIIQWEENITLKDLRLNLAKETEWYFEKYDLKMILQSVFAFADEVNKYIDETKPWTLKDEDTDTKKKLNDILFTIGRALETMGIILSPFFPEKMDEMLGRIGGESILAWSNVFEFHEKGNPLYQRIEKQ